MSERRESTSRNFYRQLSSYVSESFCEGSVNTGAPNNIFELLPSPEKDPKKKPFKVVNGEHQYPVSSFLVVYTMIFFNGCCFTAVVPSVPFYLQVLQAPASFLGWVVSFYSLGQIIGSPLAGFLTNHLKGKTLLTVSSTLGLISSVVYATAPVYMLILVSRLLTGISAGMEFTTELTFIAKNTTKQERTTFLASVTAVNVVGFIMGPALGSVLATLDITIFGVSVNQYTGPGWLLAFMFVANLFMVRGIYEDSELIEGEESDTESESEREELLKKEQPNSYGRVENEKPGDDSSDTTVDPPPALDLVLTLILVQFTVMCAFSVLETITSPLAQDNFDWDVQECNLLFTAGGAVSLVAYVVFVVASRWVQDRWLIMYALVLCLIGLILAIDWQQIPFVPLWFSNHVLGPYLNRFLAGYLIMNAGFMTGRPVTFALYSKLISSQYQGTYLGYMVAGGSAARTSGPFAAVALYYGVKKTGFNLLAVFGSVGLFHVACFALCVWQWRSLLPRHCPSSSATKASEDDEDEDEDHSNTRQQV